MEVTNELVANRGCISSLQVAKMVGKEHSKLLRDIRRYCEYLDEAKIGCVDYFLCNRYKDLKGELRICYDVTKMGCEMIANKLTGAKGVVFTAKYVKFFNEMQKHIVQNRLPKDYLSALKALVASEEEKQKLLADNENMKPKALFADSVAASKTSILIGELAKILNQNGIDIGQNRLFKWLRANGYLIRRNGTDYNMPTQRAVEMKLFTIKETSISHSNGHATISKTPKVTGKGQQYIINRFLGGLECSK